MEPTAITVFGAYWCADCRRAKEFLGEQRIPYNLVDKCTLPKSGDFGLRINFPPLT